VPGFSTSVALASVSRGSAGPPPEPVPDRWRGTGPVVLVGGLLTTAAALEPLRRWIGHLGYSVTVCTIRAGLACAEASVTRLAEVVGEAADAAGEPVRLVGYSRGGQFARVLAQDPGAPVRSLVTVGTPFDLYGVSRPLLGQALAIATAGTLGIPGLASLSCLFGSCCAGFRDRLRAPVPVPFTAVFSRADRLVRWEACVDPAARAVEVPGHHLALLTDVEPMRAVAEALASGPCPASVTATA
jgi:pimeloyl-ACP methyl ester carboxylesterase